MERNELDNAWRYSGLGDGFVGVWHNLYCAYNGFDNNIAQWNGSQWVKLGTAGYGPTILSLADFNGKIYAAGYTRDTRTGNYYYLGCWDGTNWTIQNGPNGAYLCLASAGGKLYIGTASGGVRALRMALFRVRSPVVR